MRISVDGILVKNLASKFLVAIKIITKHYLALGHFLEQYIRVTAGITNCIRSNCFGAPVKSTLQMDMSKLSNRD